jgi:multidrug efflux pump subunit AcrB
VLLVLVTAWWVYRDIYHPPRPADPPVVRVVVKCDGMAAADVENQLTRRVERWGREGTGVVATKSQSLDETSIVTFYFGVGTNLEVAVQELTGLVNGGVLPMVPGARVVDIHPVTSNPNDHPPNSRRP